MGCTTFRRIALLALLRINYSCTKMNIRPVKRLAKVHVKEGEDSFMGVSYCRSDTVLNNF